MILLHLQARERALQRLSRAEITLGLLLLRRLMLLLLQLMPVHSLQSHVRSPKRCLFCSQTIWISSNSRLRCLLLVPPADLLWPSQHQADGLSPAKQVMMKKKTMPTSLLPRSRAGHLLKGNASLKSATRLLAPLPPPARLALSSPPHPRRVRPNQSSSRVY